MTRLSVAPTVYSGQTPIREMVEFLRDPVTSSLFFKYYFLPFFGANPVGRCAGMIMDVESISRELRDNTVWLAKRLSGIHVSEGELIDPVSHSGCSTSLVRRVHIRTPDIPFLRRSAVAKINEVHGIVYKSASTKGKELKQRHFGMRLTRRTVLRFWP